MKAVAVMVSFVLALSLLAQNTCPLGYAGKTSVVSTCNHCPHKLDRPSARNTVKLVPTVKNRSSHLPLFVLAVQEKTLTLKPAPIETAPASIAAKYCDAGPYELLRPPHA